MVSHSLSDEHAAECSMSNHQDSESAVYNWYAVLCQRSYCISDKVYHELSMLVSSMPRSCELKNGSLSLMISPGGTISVQQSLHSRLCARIHALKNEISLQHQALNTHVRVELSAGGTRIGRKLHVNITKLIWTTGIDWWQRYVIVV